MLSGRPLVQVSIGGTCCYSAVASKLVTSPPRNMSHHVISEALPVERSDINRRKPWLGRARRIATRSSCPPMRKYFACDRRRSLEKQKNESRGEGKRSEFYIQFGVCRVSSIVSYVHACVTHTIWEERVAGCVSSAGVSGNARAVTSAVHPRWFSRFFSTSVPSPTESLCGCILFSRLQAVW